MAELEEGKCNGCKFFLGLTQIQDDWSGGWLLLGHCRNSEINAGLVDGGYGCGAWRKFTPPTKDAEAND